MHFVLSDGQEASNFIVLIMDCTSLLERNYVCRCVHLIDMHWVMSIFILVILQREREREADKQL